MPAILVPGVNRWMANEGEVRRTTKAFGRAIGLLGPVLLVGVLASPSLTETRPASS